MITKDRLAEKMCELRKEDNDATPTAWAILWNLLVSSLSKTEMRIYALVIAQDDGITADELASKLGLGITNVSNYLKRMVEWGLLERRKDGKAFFYSIK
jgi:DNA-binding MarR family transcriptional regulator